MTKAHRLLIVDDEPLIASMLAECVEELDYEVAGTTGDTVEALAIARHSPIDGAILDVTLKNGDSFHLAQVLLDSGVPVAFMTGRDVRSLPPRLRSTPILGKPFGMENVRSVIERLIATHEADPRNA